MSELTSEAALKLVGEIFVNHMPFNRALGLKRRVSSPATVRVIPRLPGPIGGNRYARL